MNTEQSFAVLDARNSFTYKIYTPINRTEYNKPL